MSLSKVLQVFKSLQMLVWVFILAGCASRSQVLEPMMPTPVIVSYGALDLFHRMPEAKKTTDLKIFYATNRIPKGSPSDLQYGNGIGTMLHLGEATIRFGDQNMTWAELDAASRQAPPSVSSTDIYRIPEIPLYLIKTEELAAFDTAAESATPAVLNDGERQYAAAINSQLATVDDKELMIYVHGAKATFYASSVFTAEMSHFLGRSLVGVGYAWPTHKRIAAYALGVDVKRARASAVPLADLIEFLAANTDAEKMNIVSWSAGGRVLSLAIEILRERNAKLDEQALQDKFRLGTIIFAAADVDKKSFIQRLPAINAVSSRVTVFMSDDDSVLRFGSKTMKGGERIGQISGNVDSAYERKVVAGLDKLEIINVSSFKEDRGFDIIGHRYWYTNSWASTDVLMNIRTGLEPEERGLLPVDPENLDKVWGLPRDYPERVSEALKRFEQMLPPQGKTQ